MEDSKEFVRKCVKCQENANFHRAPATELSLLTSTRPFAQWGVDLLGPFPVGPGQVKYLIVAIDYYTKWIEVVTRFGIPEVVISDNGTQFTNKKFVEFLTGETPFRLTYGVDAMILVEIGESSPRLLLKGVGESVEKDLVDEAREMAHLSEVALKQRMALCYNNKVLRREFEENDIVLRRNDIGLPTQGEGKLAANWEGTYRVKEVLGKGV
ncbi:uncharacterized protein [Arachis hypogaea]|uniref:uncharacterized protein n=1 Tax=Arachis hypogaea TaxID=3818 RepID=UPI003B217923